MSTAKLIAAIEAEKNLLEVLPVHAAMNIAYNRAIDLINSHHKGMVMVPVDVVAIVIKDHSFLANGELMCVYCGESSYHQKDIAHKDTCPIKAMTATTNNEEG